MARDHICPECGAKFDVEVAEAAFDSHYSPKYYYSDLDDYYCAPCAFLFVERDLVDPHNSVYYEREPDI